MKKISLVVPAYNEEKYITDLLESAIAQDEPFLEIIVSIDTKTRDQTEAICQQYALHNVRTIRSKSGVANVRQAGFIAAKGEIIASTDADSVLPHNWSHQISTGFYKHPKTALCYGPIAFHKHELSRAMHHLTKHSYKMFIRITQTLGRPNPAGANFAVQASIFNKINGFNTKLKTAEDIDLSRRASRYGAIRYLPKMRVYTSTRRFKGMGLLTFTSHHLKNYVTVNMQRKSSNNFKSYR
ncbi:glycosyltransferase [Candidatus Saccharibacteria bacterium]|nr:glycosyltransferase [Candidatus Saccharibacteria bacterium]